MAPPAEFRDFAGRFGADLLDRYESPHKAAEAFFRHCHTLVRLRLMGRQVNGEGVERSHPSVSFAATSPSRWGGGKSGSSPP